MTGEDRNEKEKLRRLLSLTRRAVQDYDLIREDDRVCVGLSGGKDSLALLTTLSALKRFDPKRFELSAVTIALGFEGMDFSPVKAYCDALEVPLNIVQSDIAQIVFEIRNEQNPCALCANLRRGAVNGAAAQMGCNVVALAHHKDDVIETALLSLFYEGRFYCFAPATWLERAQVRVIRPFLYVEEKEIRQFAGASSLPVVHNPCPMDRASSRAEMKTLIRTLEKENHFLRSNLFGAVKRDIWNSKS